MLGYLLYPFERLFYLGTHLKLKRKRYDTDGQHTHLLGTAGNYRCGTGTRSSAHSCGDKDHLSVILELCLDLLNALFGSLTCHLRVISGAKALGSLTAQLELDRNIGIGQSLLVGIGYNENHIMNSFAVHIFNGIASAATNAYNFYYLS